MYSGFHFNENVRREISRKALLLKYLKAGVFKVLWVEALFEKLGFCGGLVWLLGLTIQIKPGFQISLVWTGS